MLKIKKKLKKLSTILYLSPQGMLLTQKIVKILSQKEEITIICTKNSGIDNNIEKINDIKKISVGNYIINTGDLAAIILINSISRYNKNLIDETNIKYETFYQKMFELPKYISPYKIEIKNITSQKINFIKKNKIKNITSFYRPDMINRFKHE